MGVYLTQWTDIRRPCDLCVGADGLVYVAELWRPKGKKSFVHGTALEDQPGRVSILDLNGKRMGHWGGSSDDRSSPGNFIAPHGIAIDSRGDVYVAEVPYSFAIQPGWIPPEQGDHQLQKFHPPQIRITVMKRSTDHILTTHGGNLPRPAAFDALLADAKANEAQIARDLPGAVQWIVDKQIACGVDIINDGEYVKAADPSAYHGYIRARTQGWEQLPVDPAKPKKRAGVGARDAKDFPGFYQSGLWLSGSGGPVRPAFRPRARRPFRPKWNGVCTGPISYTGQAAITKDVAALKAGLKGKTQEGFIAALGALSTGAGLRNEFYKDERDYMMAVADALHQEYKAITDAGLIVQVDEPEFFTSWMFFPDWSVDQYRDYLNFAVEVINHSIRGLPMEQIRFHSCWGSGHRPHTNDIEFKHIVDLMLKLNVQAYSFEASNVRHAHEWRIWEEMKLPSGKILVPGVVSHATDLVEHPELVAERLVNFGKLVGMENVQGGTDCGIGSRVGHEEIVWAKLKAMADGAKIASKKLKG